MLTVKVKNDDGSSSLLDSDGNVTPEMPEVLPMPLPPLLPLPGPKPKREPKPKAAKAAKPAKPAKAEPRVDPETEETCEEITDRAAKAVERGKLAEAGNAYRRASKLVDGTARTELLKLADLCAGQAKEKKQPMATKKKEEKPKKPAAKKEAKPQADANDTDKCHNYPRTPAELKAAAERTRLAVATMRKKEELSDDEEAFMKQIARSAKTLAEIGEGGWPKLDKDARYLKAKNAKRTPVAQKLCKLVRVERDGREFNAYARV